MLLVVLSSSSILIQLSWNRKSLPTVMVVVAAAANNKSLYRFHLLVEIKGCLL